MKALDGAVALITGGSGGIGEATAYALAGLGASTALVARRRDRLEHVCGRISQGGGKALAVCGDVTDSAQMDKAVQDTVEAFGRIDILINNAGVMFLGPVDGSPLEEWREMRSVNVDGMLYATHAALPSLLAAASNSSRGVADIVNISSISGRRGYGNAAVYCLTKFAVNGFSEALRQEVTKKYVRVATVEPGIVRTELPNRIRPEIREPRAKALEGVEVMDPDDIAKTIAFVVSQPRHIAVDQILLRPTVLPT